MIENYIWPIAIVLLFVVGILLMLKSMRKLKIKRRKKPMENPKKKGYNPGAYKPKLITQKDMQDSLKKSMSYTKGQGQQAFKPRPLFQQQQREQYPNIRRQPEQPTTYRQTTLDEFTRKEPEPEPEPEEEPYWSSEEWEAWAMEIYKQYPEIRQFLPDWFIQAVEE